MIGFYIDCRGREGFVVVVRMMSGDVGRCRARGGNGNGRAIGMRGCMCGRGREICWRFACEMFSTSYLNYTRVAGDSPSSCGNARAMAYFYVPQPMSPIDVLFFKIPARTDVSAGRVASTYLTRTSLGKRRKCTTIHEPRLPINPIIIVSSCHADEARKAIINGPIPIDFFEPAPISHCLLTTPISHPQITSRPRPCPQTIESRSSSRLHRTMYSDRYSNSSLS